MPTFPLSASKKIADFLFISGQIGQQDGHLVSENITEQTSQAVANIASILKDNGLELKDVIDVTAFLIDQSDYDAFNAAYAEALPSPYPTRTTVTVKSLPLGARVELKVIAHAE